MAAAIKSQDAVMQEPEEEGVPQGICGVLLGPPGAGKGVQVQLVISQMG